MNIRTAIVGLIGSAAAILLVSSQLMAEPNPADMIVRGHFNADGSLTLPVGFRNWTHVGTRYKSQGINILDGLPTVGPEVLNAYVEPSALAVYQKTGVWPDGAQMAKEFSQVDISPPCDHKTGICNKDLGAGIYETGFFGLGVMIKDAKRFPNSPGHWGYFTFGHKAPPYFPTAMVSPQEKCSACHVRLASQSDFVIARGHIGMARSQP
jgi:hypothetical protein